MLTENKPYRTDYDKYINNYNDHKLFYNTNYKIYSLSGKPNFFQSSFVTIN